MFADNDLEELLAIYRHTSGKNLGIDEVRERGQRLIALVDLAAHCAEPGGSTERGGEGVHHSDS